MNRPSPRALSDWYMAQPKGDHTCADCGKVGPYYYVQAQHPYYAEGREGVSRCSDCINAINVRMKAERKAVLATEPRCEVDGCKARGTFTVAGSALMCGRHLKKAQAAHGRAMQGFGGLGLFMPVNYKRDDLLRMAAPQEVSNG